MRENNSILLRVMSDEVEVTEGMCLYEGKRKENKMKSEGCQLLVA